jgi:hypothetical protein
LKLKWPVAASADRDRFADFSAESPTVCSDARTCCSDAGNSIVIPLFLARMVLLQQIEIVARIEVR